MTVSGEVRYTTAGSETVARIQARDHVLEIFVTLSAALVSFGLVNPKYSFYSVLLGYAALATALLSRHHDIIIGLLGKFQRELAADGSPLPNWFDPNNEYFERVLHERLLRDVSLFLFLGVGGGFGLALSRSFQRPLYVFNISNLKVVFWDTSAICWLLALLVVIWTGVSRQNLLGKESNWPKVLRYLFIVIAMTILISLAAVGVYSLFAYTF